MLARLRHLKEKAQKAGLLEAKVLLPLIGIMLCLWFFQEIAEEMVEGDTHTIDTAILMLMRDHNNPGNPWGPAWLEDVMRDFSALGGIAVISLLSLLSALYLLITRQYTRAGILAVTVITGTVLSNFLKSSFDRPRPDFIPNDITVFTASFPSGHSLMSALVYLTLGALLAESQKDARVKLFLMGVAICLTFIIGVSRLYLGVHWPSDVLAGWIVGAFWALVCWSAEKLILRRK